MDIPYRSPEESLIIKKRISDFLQGAEVDRSPFFFGVSDVNTSYAQFLERTNAGRKNTAKMVRDDEFDLTQQLQTIETQLKLNEKYPDDRIFYLKPFTGLGVVASAFGCRTLFFDNQDPWTEHILTDIHEIKHLKPDIKKSDLFNISLRKARYYRERVQDKIPINIPVIINPMDTACTVMKEEDLIFAMIDEPELVHALMRMITEVTIEMFLRFRDLTDAREWTPGGLIYMPSGIWMASDMLAIFSPDLYREFGIPYINQISETLGGVFLHSCGSFLHNLPNLDRIKNLRGINFGQIPLRKIEENTLQNSYVFFPSWVENVLDAPEALELSGYEKKELRWRELDVLEELQKKYRVFFMASAPKGQEEEYYARLIEIVKR